MFNLPALVALAVDTPTASAIDLSPSTILLVQAALAFAYDLSLWQGSGFTLTDAEIEAIHDMISTAEGEVLP